MSETAVMSSRPRHTCRSPATFVAASVVFLSIAAPELRSPQKQEPDPGPAFKNPSGIAVDRDGTVYVSSQGDSSVVVYAPRVHGLVTPIRRIGPSSGLVSPQAIALDSRGNLLVASGPRRPVGKGSITVYAPGAMGDVAPLRVIAGAHTGLSEPSALALGPGGRLYVLNGPYARVTNNDGLSQGIASTVVVFDALAAGDQASEGIPLEILDTIVKPPPPPLPPVPEKVDTVCGKPSPSGGAVLCQILTRGEPRVIFRLPPPRQHPDTIRPLDVTATAGRLLMLTARGVTAYDRAMARRSRPYDRISPDSMPSGGVGFRGLRIASGPAGELFVARGSPIAEHIASLAPGRGSSAAIGGFGSLGGLGGIGGTLRVGPNLLERVPANEAPTKTDTAPTPSQPQQPSISVYGLSDSGDTTSLRTIAGPHTALEQVADLAVGRDGSLYVLTSAGSDTLRIAVFAAGAHGDVAPMRVIEGPKTGLKGATSLALDRRGRIYVANNRKDEDPVLGTATITVYASDADGNATPVSTIGGWSTRLSNPSGIAVADDGTIYVANLGVYTDDQGSVQTFAARATDGDKAARTLVGRGAGLAGLQSIAVGRGDTLYVLNGQPRRIAIYPPGADGPIPPVRTIEGHRTELRLSPNLYGPELLGRMAIDAAGYLYVADPAQASGLNAYGPDLGAIGVFRPETDGNEFPVRTIIGGFTKLNGPGGVAVDHPGNLYVPNRYGTGPGSVTVYGPSADGDVRPLRMIAGAATRLEAPAAVALDAHDTLYVVNATSVTIYAPGAAGDVAPVRTIAAE